MNVASRCGFTQQYDGLQALWKKYQDQGLVVVGVPCNQFGNQGRANPLKSPAFVAPTLGSTFLYSKNRTSRRKPKRALCPLDRNPAVNGKGVKWNFEKFLVDPNGQVLARYRSNIAPDDPKLVAAIEQGLQNL